MSASRRIQHRREEQAFFSLLLYKQKKETRSSASNQCYMWFCFIQAFFFGLGSSKEEDALSQTNYQRPPELLKAFG